MTATIINLAAYRRQQSRAATPAFSMPDAQDALARAWLGAWSIWW